eukprot:6576575-Alexandrium_andersonii.AAC.1
MCIRDRANGRDIELRSHVLAAHCAPVEPTNHATSQRAGMHHSNYAAKRLERFASVGGPRFL